MWVLIDNYDSFTHILHHYLLQTGNECKVFRNDEITVEELKQINPERIIISPGPETPLQAGICLDVIDRFYQTTPILGICLGHQALGMYFGAKLIHAPYPMHGKTSELMHHGHELFDSISSPFTVMRYHSLSIENLAGTGLKAIAHSNDDNQIMAIVHERYPCVGIQFHPESVGTVDGMRMLANWAGMY
ncbi:MAG TPA: aminodeoxychorismate/anthranilate synthase component II [Flavipsychrobacter sp.]|nr:aminodeoxychorismate/anthranilate synthase component II [Flavipsychrobacter sp.]